MNKRATKKNKVMLYEQDFNPADILLYLPEPLKRKLSGKEKQDIKKAFLEAVTAYQKIYEENYLNRMLL